MQLAISTFFLLVVISVLAAAAPANEHANEYDYEDEVEPAAPALPAVGRGRLSLLNTRGQRAPSPLIGSRGAGKQTSTAKPVEPPAEPAESENDEEYPEEGAEETPATTTTEAPKRSLVRGGVRPFRSNEDLLAALKRRREQQLHGGSPKVLQVYPTPSSTQPAEENKTSKSPNGSNGNGNGNGSSSRRRFNNNKASAAAGSSSEPVVAEQPDSSRRSVGSRRFSGRSKPTTPNNDNIEIEEEVTPKPKSTYRRRP